MNDIMETDRGRVPWGVEGGENNSENIEIFRNKEAQKWPLTNQENIIKTNTKLLGEKGGENNI